MSACFFTLPLVIKKIKRKMLPKDSKIIRLPSIVPFIWIAHAWLRSVWQKNRSSLNFGFNVGRNELKLPLGPLL
jgi:hypothetical protein